MASLGIQLIFGGASFGGMGSEFDSVAETKNALSILAKNDVRTIDTATVYINSEDLLGQAGVSGLGFSIDTKYPGGFAPQPSTKDDVIARAEESLRQLNIDHINIYYIHAPDRRVALKELLDGMNTLHQAGKFKQLGLSNFLPDEVEEVIRIAKEHSYVLPSVYQGNYNAVSRHAETRLLPILRKHEISYYAYSPIAGGFLTKDVAQFASGAEGRGRWDPHDAVGAIYNSMYGGPGLLNGLRLWGKIAEDSGIPKAELAYRWVAYHSALDAARGDSMIFGSRNVQQIRGTLAGLRKGPLPGEIVEQIEMIWNMVEDNAPVDNFNHFNGK